MKQRCRDCGGLFVPYPRKPGYVNQCLWCATESGDEPLLVASQSEDDSGCSFFPMEARHLRKHFGGGPFTSTPESVGH